MLFETFRGLNIGFSLQIDHDIRQFRMQTVQNVKNYKIKSLKSQIMNDEMVYFLQIPENLNKYQDG